MSLEAITWAFKQTLDPGSKITLLALADYADDDGRSFPRVKTLAEKTSLSVRTVRDRLRKLEELGYLVTSSQERLDGSQMSNEYTLVGLYPPADLAGGGGAQLPGGRQTLADHEPSSTPQEKPPVAPQDDDDFEEIWSAWPRKDSKQPAKKRWQRLSSKKRAEITPLLVAHANAYRQHTPPQYIPYLTTWLRDEGWQNPLAVSRERGAYKPEPKSAQGMVIPQGHVPVRNELGQIIGSRPA